MAKKAYPGSVVLQILLHFLVIITSPIVADTLVAGRFMVANQWQYIEQIKHQADVVVDILNRIRNPSGLDVSNIDRNAHSEAAAELNDTALNVLQHINQTVAWEVEESSMPLCVIDTVLKGRELAKEVQALASNLKTYISCATRDKCHRSLNKTKSSALESCARAATEEGRLQTESISCGKQERQDTGPAGPLNRAKLAGAMADIGSALSRQSLVVEHLVALACSNLGREVPTALASTARAKIVMILDKPITEASTLAPAAETSNSLESKSSTKSLKTLSLTLPSTKRYIAQPLKPVSARIQTITCGTMLNLADPLLPGDIPTIASVKSKVKDAVAGISRSGSVEQASKCALLALEGCCDAYPRFKWRVIVSPYSILATGSEDFFAYTVYRSCEPIAANGVSGFHTSYYNLLEAGTVKSNWTVHVSWFFDANQSSVCRIDPAQTQVAILSEGAKGALVSLLGQSSYSTSQRCQDARAWSTFVCASGNTGWSGLLLEKANDQSAIALSSGIGVLSITANLTSSAIVTYFGNFATSFDETLVVDTQIKSTNDMPSHANADVALARLVVDRLQLDNLYQCVASLLINCRRIGMHIQFSNSTEHSAQNTTAALLGMLSIEELWKAIALAGSTLGGIFPDDEVASIFQAAGSKSSQNILARLIASLNQSRQLADKALDADWHPFSRNLRGNLATAMERLSLPAVLIHLVNDSLTRFSAAVEGVFYDFPMLLESIYWSGITAIKTPEAPLRDAILLAKLFLEDFRKLENPPGALNSLQRIVRWFCAETTRQYTSLPEALKVLDFASKEIRKLTRNETESVVAKLHDIGAANNLTSFENFRRELALFAANATIRVNVTLVEAQRLTSKSPSRKRYRYVSPFSKETQQLHARIVANLSLALSLDNSVRSYFVYGKRLFNGPSFSMFINNIFALYITGVDLPVEVMNRLNKVHSSAGNAIQLLVDDFRKVLTIVTNVRRHLKSTAMLLPTLKITSEYSSLIENSLSLLTSSAMGMNDVAVAMLASTKELDSFSQQLNDLKSASPLMPVGQLVDFLPATSHKDIVVDLKQMAHEVMKLCIEFAQKLPPGLASISAECIQSPAYFLWDFWLQSEPNKADPNAISRIERIKALAGGRFALDYYNMLYRATDLLILGHIEIEKFPELFTRIDSHFGRSLQLLAGSNAQDMLSDFHDNVSQEAENNKPLNRTTATALIGLVEQLLARVAPTTAAIFLERRRLNKTIVRDSAHILTEGISFANAQTSKIMTELNTASANANKSIYSSGREPSSSLPGLRLRDYAGDATISLHEIKLAVIEFAKSFTELSDILKETVIADLASLNDLVQSSGSTDKDLREMQIYSLVDSAADSVFRLGFLLAKCNSFAVLFHETMNENRRLLTAGSLDPANVANQASSVVQRIKDELVSEMRILQVSASQQLRNVTRIYDVERATLLEIQYDAIPLSRNATVNTFPYVSYVRAGSVEFRRHKCVFND